MSSTPRCWRQSASRDSEEPHNTTSTVSKQQYQTNTYSRALVKVIQTHAGRHAAMEVTPCCMLHHRERTLLVVMLQIHLTTSPPATPRAPLPCGQAQPASTRATTASRWPQYAAIWAGLPLSGSVTSWLAPAAAAVEEAADVHKCACVCVRVRV